MRLEHTLNADIPINITLSGMAMLARFEHPEKALLPILLMLCGIMMLMRLVQPEKTPSPIVITSSGMTTVPTTRPWATAIRYVPESIRNSPSCVAYFPLKENNDEHPPNAPFPILVTLSGIVMLVRLEHL